MTKKSTPEPTFYDTIKRKLADNKLATYISLAVIVIGGLAALFGNVDKIYTLSKRYLPAWFYEKTIKSSPISADNGSDRAHWNENIVVGDVQDNDIITLSGTNGITVNIGVDSESSIKTIDALKTIRPTYPYLHTLQEDGPIKAVLGGSPFKFQYPALDLKWANHSGESLLITAALITVKRSQTDSFPILMLDGICHGFKFPLQNIGWGMVYDCKLRFSILTAPPQSDLSLDSLKYEITLRDFKEFPASLDIARYFFKEGVDTSFIFSYYGNRDLESDPEFKNKYQQALGKFQSGRAYIRGVIEYAGRAFDQTLSADTLEFMEEVSFTPPVVVSPALMISAKYIAKFNTDDENYSFQVPISQTIAAEASDRFVIFLQAPHSSRHVFDLTLVYNNNQEITISNIDFYYFQSRADMDVGLMPE